MTKSPPIKPAPKIVKNRIVEGVVDFPLVVSPHIYKLLEDQGMVKDGKFTPKGNTEFPTAKRTAPNSTGEKKWKRIPMTSHNDNWKTPIAFKEELNKEFGFDFDPCPEDPNFDGLNTEWGLSNFVNPPFSKIKDWIKKGYAEYQRGKSVVFLIPARTDTNWWHDYCMKATELRFIRGRLKYQGAKHNAPFPSCLVIFKPTPTNSATDNSSEDIDVGEFLKRWADPSARKLMRKDLFILLINNRKQIIQEVRELVKEAEEAGDQYGTLYELLDSLKDGGKDNG